jgi:hypothetical protein
MAHFLNVYIVPNNDVSRKDVETVLNKAKDWIRYGTGNYIVYTNADVQKWKTRLISLAKPQGNLLVVKLDIRERSGFMSDKLWLWLNSKPEGIKRG